ncbi:hypothetical protein MACJ_000712 [Theileria orientalis]|uniref:C3H1-type domain-containing protein n=1 Tax=Theileria orientalis TaxID=68886 RepID=A0A976QQM8_THEOR|nr:hypothetical protein MACJ_000712 [Theileria orientalis]
MRGTIPISRSFDPDHESPFLSYKFKRRCPIRYFYIPIECPFMLGCKDGYCPLSHTVLEVIFHPILHKTKKCSLAIKGQCKFEKKCAFYHSEKDRLASYLSWLVWQKNWEMYDKNVKVVLSKYALSSKIISKIVLMINIRSNLKSLPIDFPKGTDCVRLLEDELNNLISSCESSLEIMNA